MSSVLEKYLHKKKTKFLAMPDDTMFFWSSYGYVGNSINLWALGSSGYTTDPTKAQQYTKAETLAQMDCDRPQDSFFLVSEVLANMEYHIDMQKIKTRF